MVALSWRFCLHVAAVIGFVEIDGSMPVHSNSMRHEIIDEWQRMVARSVYGNREADREDLGKERSVFNNGILLLWTKILLHTYPK